MVKTMKILVVDDKETNRNELIAGLIEHGFIAANVKGVESGEKAVELVKADPDFFDVAVVDHILKNQEMDGIETIKRIREYSSKISPIIFTNIPSDNPLLLQTYRTNAYKAGAYRYMYRKGADHAVSQVEDFITQINQLSKLRDRVREYYEAQQNVPSLLTQLDIMITLVDRDFKVWYMNDTNKRFQKITDLPHSPCFMAFFGKQNSCPCCGCIVQQTLADGINRERIYLQPISGLNGKLKWIYSWTQPMSDEKGVPLLADDGKPIAVLESSQDLSNSVRLQTMPLEERLHHIALALNEREDGFDRVRIYKANPGSTNLNLVATAGYPEAIKPVVLDINHFPNIKKSIRHFKRNNEGLYHEWGDMPDTVYPAENLRRFIHWPIIIDDRFLGLISVSDAPDGRPCTIDKIDIVRNYALETYKAFNATERPPVDRDVEEIISTLDKLLIQKRTSEETLQTLIDEVYQLTDSDNVQIRYRHEDRATLLPICRGKSMGKAPLDIGLSDRAVPSVRAIVTGQEEINNNVSKTTDVIFFQHSLPLEEWNEKRLLGAYCIQPLIFQNHCTGSLTLFKNKKDHYDEKKIKIARAITERLALTVRDYLINTDRMRKDYAFASSINAVVFADMENRINYMNPSFLKMWGYDNEKEVLGKPFAQLWQHESEAAEELDIFQHDEGWIGELVASKKDGSTFHAQLSANPVKDTTGKVLGTMASCIDITERKRLERVQESIYLISEEARSSQNLTDLFQRIQRIVNDLMTTKNFYIALYDELTKTVSFPYFMDEYDLPPEPRKEKQGMTEFVIRKGETLLASEEKIKELIETKEIHKMGEMPISWIGAPLKTPEGKTIGVLAVQRYKGEQQHSIEDKEMLEFVSGQIAMVIQRKQEEEKKDALLKENSLMLLEKEAMLTEKETMLKEIYHRVKNNFNLITNLLDLQGRRIKNEGIIEQFRFTQDRIMSMAMVHEKLYQSESLSALDFGEYIQDLLNALMRSHDTDEIRIPLQLEIQKNIFLGLDKAIPCGLIINELFTNSLKYAFPAVREKKENQNDEVIVKFCMNDENTILLSVCDNGVGLPENIDFFNTNSLGLLLVRMLSEQIDGTIQLDQKNGTSVSIVFKTENYKRGG